MLATTALTAAVPVAAFAAGLTVDGVTQTIATPETFDFVRVGVTQPNSQLDIVTGGVVSVPNSFVTIGDGAGSSGTVTITGSGAQLSTTNLYVGVSGSGALTVTDGGLASTDDRVLIGYDAGSFGAVTVSGAGSNLAVGGQFYVGRFGSGTMTVSGGGVVSSDYFVSLGGGTGSSGTVTVSGTGSRFTAGGNVLVGDSGSGVVTISGGGTVSASTDNVVLGNQAGSSGIATISGAGSQLTAADAIFVGNAGSGTLTVSGGGLASAGTDVIIGNSAGASGTVTVSGAGSLLKATNEIFVGKTGSGTLTVSGGGQVSALDSVIIGDSAGASGAVTVSGAGSQLAAKFGIEVGASGSGTLVVANGGVAVAGLPIDIAVSSGSVGTLVVGAASGDAAVAAGNVAGSGGTAANIQFGAGDGKIVFNHTDAALDFTANVSGNGDILALSGTTKLSGTVAIGSGRLEVDGGVVQIGGTTSAATVLIGDAANSTGAVTVSGAGSQLTATSDVFVGNSGNGALIVSGGGAVSASGNINIGLAFGSTGTVTISGAGSQLTANGGAGVGIAVGNYGTGVMNVLDGGVASTTGRVVIANTSASGTVTIAGAGSRLTAGNTLYVGAFGNGELNVAAGGVAGTSANVVIGFSGSGGIATGTVTVSGAGSILTSAGEIAVGNFGSGSLTVSDGGLVSSGKNVIIAKQQGGVGTVTVSGAGSTLTTATDYVVLVGDAGTGTVTVSGGGVVSSGGSVGLGNTGQASGTVTVAGSGSQLTAASYIRVGNQGSGTLAVSDGGVVRASTFIQLGNVSGSSGTVTVSGNGSTAQADSFFVGSYGSGNLNVSNRGVVEAVDTLTIAESSGSTGTLNFGAAAGSAPAAAGRVQGANGAAANIAFGAGTGSIVFNHTDFNYVFNATVSGSGTLSQLAGVTSLTGDLTGFTGATNVSGGTLSVDTVLGGPVNLLAGGTVGGTGTINDLIVSAGGTLAPGSVANPYGTLTIADPLTFVAGSFYAVQVSGLSNSFTLANSSADLGGATVKAVFGNTGTVSLTQPYKIFTATGGLSGTFDPIVSSNLANLKATLSYDANDVFINFAFGYQPGLNGNQQAVADALTRAFNATGIVPLQWGALDAQGLSQAAGETATGSQQTAFEAMNRFINLMADPGAGYRGEETGQGTGGAPLAYAGAGRPANAMAAITKTTYAKAPTAVFSPSWKVWAAGFGGSETTNGNAAAGSSSMTSSIYGAAAGADYRFAPDWTAGFALAGGGSNFKVAGSGDGRSDLFQAGGFVRHTMGPAYVSAALAYGFQDVTITRNVAADRLQARFDTNTFSGRIEGGWRFFTPVLGGVGVTPYAAAQITATLLPNYTETVLSGGNTFALAYESKTVTDPLSELGVRTDKSFALLDGTVLTLRGRAAWAHDFNPNRSASATFQALPLASFVVNGAAQASDAALTSASAEVSWASGWSAGLTFDGAFSDVTSSYAGKGVVRRAW